jgi:hypothetical protein
VPTFTVTAEDRTWFDRCHRAWDLGALGRQALVPVVPPPRDPLASALLDAFAVYYFPGMWEWDRTIVAGLVSKAYDEAGGPASGRRVLDGFQKWAPTVDHFTPIRVQFDLDVPIADPGQPDVHLTTEAGDRIRYRDRVPLAVIAEEDDRCWLVEHRVVEQFADGDELFLDERALVACWAWGEVELALPAAGTQYTELRVDPPSLRRTTVARSRATVTAAATRLGRTALAMVANDVGIDPTPAWSHCRRCPFRTPCVEIQRGEDAAALLATGYRARGPDDLEEGRLGGASWGLGRGARPQRFR